MYGPITGALAVMFTLVWTWRVRYLMTVLGALLVVGMTAVKPGMISTFQNLFLAGETDPNA